MTAQSKVYREELQEFSRGDRIRRTQPAEGQSLRKGDFGTITAIGDGIELRLDKGPAVKLTADQARHIEHGYIASLIGAICPVFLGFAAWAIARFEH